jgi:hypothetical protein
MMILFALSSYVRDTESVFPGFGLMAVPLSPSCPVTQIVEFEDISFVNIAEKYSLQWSGSLDYRGTVYVTK